MSNVHHLDAYRPDPHIVFPDLEGNVHVIPVVLIEDWISGAVPFDPEAQLLLRSIINDWRIRALGI